MKLIHLTDTPIVLSGERLFGLDPKARLQAAIASINAEHGDAALCVISGDLVNGGSVPEYEALRACLDSLALPFRLMVGNHDDRHNFTAVFPDSPLDAHGFVQSTVATAEGRVILLDTHEPGVPWGSYCGKRLGWLREQLDEAGARPVYLFMHHPPFAIGIPSLDRMTMRDDAPFAELLGGYPNIRHLFFGHVHRPIAGSWRGIPISAMRSTNHQVALDLKTTAPVPKNLEPAGYGVVFIDEQQTIVHLHEYLHTEALPG